MRAPRASLLCFALFSLAPALARPAANLGPETPADATVADSLELPLFHDALAVGTSRGLLLRWGVYGPSERRGIVLQPDGTFGPLQRTASTDLAYNTHLVPDRDGAFEVYARWVSSGRYRITGWHLGPDGAPREAAPFALPFGDLDQRDPSAACGPSACLVSLVDGNTLRWVLVRPDGTFTAPGSRAVPDFTHVLAGSAGSAFFLALYTYDGATQTLALDADGAASSPRDLGTLGSSQLLLSDGAQAQLLWLASVPGDAARTGTFALTLDPSGAPLGSPRHLDNTPDELHGASLEASQLTLLRGPAGPSGASTTPWRMQRFDAAGALLSTRELALENYGRTSVTPTLAGGGGGLFLWGLQLVSSTTPLALRAWRVGPDALSPSRVVPPLPAPQHEPRWSRDAAGTTLTWLESRTARGQLLQRRFDTTGAPSSPRTLAAATEDFTAFCLEVRPAPGVEPPAQLVQWNTLESTAFGSSPHGVASVLSADGATASSSLYTPLTCSGNSGRPRSLVSNGHLLQLLPGPRSATLLVDPQRSPSAGVALSGSSYSFGGDLLSVDGAPVAWWVDGATLHRDALHLRADGVVDFTESTAPFSSPSTQLWFALGGRTVLALELGASLRAQRFTVLGMPVDAAPLVLADTVATSASEGALALLRWDGAAWVVAYALARGAATELHLARLEQGATSLLVEDTLVPTAGPVRSLDLLTDAVGYARLAYSAEDPALGAERAYYRALSWGSSRRAQGSECAEDAQCASGHCADGVCCDTACNEGACFACSTARGAATDGHCGPRSAGSLCRSSTGPCDAEERCDGAQPACPAEQPSTCGRDAGPEASPADAAREAAAEASVEASRDAGASAEGGPQEASAEASAGDAPTEAGASAPRAGGGCACSARGAHGARGWGFVPGALGLLLAARRTRRRARVCYQSRS